MKRLLLTVAVLLLLGGCTSFRATVYRADGTTVREVIERGAPLLSRKASFTIRHEWLDENNVLHEETIIRGVDENADGQFRALELVRDLALEAGKTAVK